jgi:hypothetical protein
MKREVPTNTRYKTTKQAKQRGARRQGNEPTNGGVRRYMRCNGSKATETKKVVRQHEVARSSKASRHNNAMRQCDATRQREAQQGNEVLG